jgi:alkanesulfonate monooxygenase SsuD/methylene tetrahydromethanopterin reductase-like flavin-dependent oxidoreductase (luciferase family)
MKIRFAVGPHARSVSGAELTTFAESLDAAGFDGLWLSDLPVAPVLDPLLGLALAAARTRRLHLGANLVPLGRDPISAREAVGPARSDHPCRTGEL